MVGIEIEYAGGLRTECKHGPSGAALTTDAPVDNHGRGESYSPTDLVATALGTCMLTVMGIRAESEGWEMKGAHVSVEKHMVTQPLRRVGRLVVRISMPTTVPEDAREILERIAWTCPVKESLHPETDLDVRFDWRAA
jgi:putative redox protein